MKRVLERTVGIDKKRASLGRMMVGRGVHGGGVIRTRYLCPGVNVNTFALLGGEFIPLVLHISFYVCLA